MSITALTGNEMLLTVPPADPGEGVVGRWLSGEAGEMVHTLAGINLIRDAVDTARDLLHGRPISAVLNIADMLEDMLPAGAMDAGDGETLAATDIPAPSLRPGP